MHLGANEGMAMMAPTLFTFSPLLALLICAAAIDLRCRRIPNWLTLALVVTGLMQSFTAGGTISPVASLLGLLAGAALMLPPFALRALGGGDVKLLAGIGAWMGAGGALAVFLAAAVIGLVVVITQSIWHRRLWRLLHNSLLLAVNIAHVRQLGIQHTSATGAAVTSIDQPLPYAVPMLLATALVLFGRGGI